MATKKINKTNLRLALLLSMLSMLLAGLFTSYIFFREYQYRQGFLCSDVTDHLRRVRSDILSDDSEAYMRAKALKLIATIYSEIRTGLPLERLSPSVLSMEVNDLAYMCAAYPDYRIGEIVRYDSDKYLEERSRFNREFSNMLGWQKIEQDYQLAQVGNWLSTELKK